MHNSGVSTYHVRTGQQLQLPACQWMLVRETLPPCCPTLHVCIHVLFLLPPTVSDDANQGPAPHAFLNLRDGLHVQCRDKNEFTLGASSLGGGGADDRRGEGRGDEARWAGMRWVCGWGGGGVCHRHLPTLGWCPTQRLQRGGYSKPRQPAAAQAAPRVRGGLLGQRHTPPCPGTPRDRERARGLPPGTRPEREPLTAHT